MKICNNCNIQKDFSLFSKRSVNKDGLNNRDSPVNEVNNLTNLQPLWAFENLRKSNK